MKALERKQNLIEKLFEMKKEYTKKNIEYKETKCKIMLETDFKTVLDSSRPTVDEKKAYIASNTLEMREEKEQLYNEIEYIRLQIELCNDEMNLEQ